MSLRGLSIKSGHKIGMSVAEGFVNFDPVLRNSVCGDGFFCHMQGFEGRFQMYKAVYTSVWGNTVQFNAVQRGTYQFLGEHCN